jgi:hypothetical protein
MRGADSASATNSPEESLDIQRCRCFSFTSLTFILIAAAKWSLDDTDLRVDHYAPGAHDRVPLAAAPCRRYLAQRARYASHALCDANIFSGWTESQGRVISKYLSILFPNWEFYPCSQFGKMLHTTHANHCEESLAGILDHS